MELEFVKRGNNYEAIFEAPSDFNIHIELNKPSYLGVYQSSIQNGEYSFTTEYKLNNIQKVYDIDFGALVYPKWIKVVSGSEVVSASVNFNEGGGSGNGSGDEWIYIRLSNLEAYLQYYALSTLSSITSTSVYGQNYIGVQLTSFVMFANISTSNIKAIGINLGLEVNAGGNYVKLKDIIDTSVIDPSDFITKEEFYNLEV